MALLSTFSITDFASSVSISSSYLPHLSLAKQGFPDSSVGKESAFNARDPSSIPGSGRSTGVISGLATSKVSILAVQQKTEDTPGPTRNKERPVGCKFESRMSVAQRHIVQGLSPT